MSSSCQQGTKNKAALSQRSLDLDIITLRRINIRAPNNSIVNSNSILISDGNGQAYWGPQANRVHITCNVYIPDNYYSAGLSKYSPKLSNLDYYLDNNDMGSYLFFRSPSNLNIYPPGVNPNSAPQPIQGNYFVLKNLGSNNINVYINPIIPFLISASNSKTFFYVGTPQNFWTTI